jgi:hypothetical protein
MTKEKRLKVYQKYGGLCAYTGKPLSDDWQVDHVTSQFSHTYWYTGEEDYGEYKKKVHDIDNLLPCLRIVNHYKREKSLYSFRMYMTGFHKRLAKLPKTTRVPATERRIKYMNSVAEAFGITVDKPFSGKFYFENLTE